MQRSILRNYIGLLSLAIFALTASAQQRAPQLQVMEYVKVGAYSPAAASAAVDIASITKGLLIPRMTSAQRTAIPSPATSLLVFNTTTGNFEYWDGSQWKQLGAGAAITELQGDVTAVGPGVAIATISDLPFTKMLAQSVNKVPVFGATGYIEASAVSATELDKLFGVTSSVCGISQSCTFTNKTYNNSVFTGTFTGPWTTAGPLITSGSGVVTSEANLAIARGGTGAGTTQAAINNLLPIQTGNAGKYLKTDGTNVSFDSVAGGDKNYGQSVNDGTSNSAINTYNDGGAVPTDGTGGTPSGVTKGYNTGSPLRGTSHILLSKDGVNRQGQGWSYDFTLDKVDAESGVPINVSFSYITDANYVDGEITMYVYDRDGPGLYALNSFSTGGNGLIASTSRSTPWTGFFYPRTASRNFRVVFHIATTTTASTDFGFIDLKIQRPVPLAIADGPISEVIGIGSSQAPTGFLPLQGQTLSRTTYRDLFLACSICGVGDGSTTFTLPNGNAAFMRGIGSQTFSGINYTKAIGQEVDAFQGHWHQTYSPTGAGGTFVWGMQAWTNNRSPTLSATPDAGIREPINDGANGGPRYTTETRPMNIGVYFYIRYAKSGNVMSVADTTSQTLAPLTLTSAQKTPAAGSQWQLFTNNSIVLTPGKWRLFGGCSFGSNGSVPGYTYTICEWRGGNGADSASAPASLASVVTVNTVNTGTDTVFSTGAYAAYPQQSPEYEVTCSAATCTVFLDTYIQATTPANARITVYGNAKRIPDFQQFFNTSSALPSLTQYNGAGVYTYNVPAGAAYLRIRATGSGGGGAGSGVGTLGAGGTGGTTTVGSIISITGGAGGAAFGAGGTIPVGGLATLTGITGFTSQGAQGTQVSYNVTTNNAPAGGIGGNTPMGHSCGGGGQGAIAPSAGSSGGGGAAGGFTDAIVRADTSAWASSYTITINAGGTAGAAGTSGGVGQAGNPGCVWIEAYYPMVASNSQVSNASGYSEIKTVTSTTTLNASDTMILCNASGGAVTLNVPACSGLAKKRYTMKKIDSSGNACTFDPNASETVDGSATNSITTQYAAKEYICDGTAWYSM